VPAAPEAPAQSRSIPATAVWVMLALAAAACSATSFLDPEGPRYYESTRSGKPDDTAGAPGRPLRLVTFNLEFGRETERAIQLIRTNDALRDPDILLLQEMSGSGVTRVAAGLDLNYLYYPSGIHPQAHQEFGTAILSPLRIGEPSKLVLPFGAAVTGLRRAVTVATIRWRGVPIRVFSVHLPGPLSIAIEERQAQVRVILDAARAQPGPVIVAGDFNSRSIGPWFERGGFTWVTKHLPGTSRGPGFWLSYDHVFARGFPATGGTWAAGCVDAPGTSDHRAVWVTLGPGAPSAGPKRSG